MDWCGIEGKELMGQRRRWSDKYWTDIDTQENAKVPMGILNR